MINTYDELKAAIGSWLKRSGLENEIPNFIQLAEAHFNRTIRALEMEARARVTASSEYTALPSDFIAMREIHLEGSVDQKLTYYSPQELTDIEGRQLSGKPAFYTILDGQIKLYPAPSVENPAELEMIYIQKIPALSDSNSTNWLLSSHPDIYLHCALFQAEGFFYNDQRMPIWERKCELAIAALNQQANQKRLGTGPMMPRVRNVI